MRYPILSSLSLALLGVISCGDESMQTQMDMMPAETPLNEKLVGTWSSMSCESAGSLMGISLFIKRTYKFTSATEFTVNGDVYGDQNCAFKLLTLDSKGTFTTGSDVSAVQGAKEINLTSSARGVTGYLAQATTILNTLKCGGFTNWSAGVRQDVSIEGCDPLVPSVTSCMIEYDVALLSDATTLKVGTRPTTPTGLCSGRPTTVGLPLIKQ